MRDIVSPLDGIRSPFGQRRTFTPLSLFSAGEVGAWYDSSDFSTMFQDAAGTTPVTAVEQPVGLIRDKSGRGNHASQTTSTSRPVLKQDANGKYYLFFDGTDDSMATATIDPGSVDKAQVFAGVRKIGTAWATIAELSANADGNDNGFYFSHSVIGSDDYIVSDDVPGNRVYTYATGYTSPITNVVSSQIDKAQSAAADQVALRINGSVPGSVVYTKQGAGGVGNFGNYPLYVGARFGTTSRSLWFNGNLYQLLVRFSATNLDAATITATETWVASKTGVTL